MLNLEGGGAERAILSLANDLVCRGYKVDFILAETKGEYLVEASPNINIVDLSASSPLKILFKLVCYLRQNEPNSIMAALDQPNILLILAAKLAQFTGKTIVSQRAVIDASQYDTSSFRRFVTKKLQRICFRMADAVISNSYAATEELQSRFKISKGRLFTINNAIDLKRITALALEPLEDPFISNTQLPFLVSVGSLTDRKDIPTLIRSFQYVRAQREIKLVIIGKGPEVQNIKSLIIEFGLGDDVKLIGFDANPYKWIGKANAFVSSSKGEGFPNVIAEALALSCPVVATKCPGDTSKLLENGKWGQITPIGDAKAMADAILKTLDMPTPIDTTHRAANFSPESVLSQYLDILATNTSRHLKQINK